MNVDELLREVEADSATLGLVLHGSRAGGSERPGSDYDLVRVVTDERYERGPVHEKGADTDVILQTPERLRRLAGAPDWYTSAVPFGPRPRRQDRRGGGARGAHGRARVRARVGRRPRAAEGALIEQGA